MTRKRSVVVVLSLALAGGLALAQSGDDLAKKVEALEKKVEALEKQINYLEGYVGRRLNSFAEKLSEGGSGAAAAAPSAEVENEAREALTSINRLVANGEFAKAKTEIGTFMTKYQSTATARNASKLNAELQVIGREAPKSWGIQKWFQGEKDINLAGGTTLVVFWELWCPHCKREVPKLQALYEKLKGDGLQVVGLTKLTKSTTEDGVRAFMAEQKVAYPIAKEDGTVSQHFNVSGIPAAAVIKDGKVVWRGHPAGLDETMLKGWL